MSEDRGSGFWVGLLLGAVAGAAIGLLWSPRSGKENRELFFEKCPELREQGPDLLRRATEEIKARLDAGLEAYRKGASETRERLSRELDASQGNLAS
ncbi:MAG TPA: YtxH domain-containing protein [Chloroflexota bacterium]|nr:YtxH domain-containing protein [Chloroflexota bacterium]